MGQIRAGGGEGGGEGKEYNHSVRSTQRVTHIQGERGSERRSSRLEKGWTDEVAAEGAGDIFESV